MIPVPTTPPWFAFLVHPRSLSDVHAVGGGLIAKSTTRCQARQTLREIAPRIIAVAKSDNSLAQGEIIAVPRLPEDLFGADGQAAIRSALGLAVDRGARVVGLGGLVSPATAAGAKLVREVPRHVVVTNGNALTAGVLFENVLDVVDRLGAPERGIAVVGATGSVGVPLAGLLHRLGLPLTLIGRSEQRVRSLLAEVCPNARCSGAVDDIYAADIVILLVTEIGEQLAASRFAPGSVILDAAQPHGLDACLRATLSRRGVRVAEGGIVHFPGTVSGFDFGLPNRSCAFACLAETYLCARTAHPHHSVGRPHPDRASELLESARRIGIRSRPVEWAA